MTVASNQPSLALANDAENLVVKNAQPKKVNGASIKHGQKDISREKSSHIAQPVRKAPVQGSLNKTSGQRGLGFPYKAKVPQINPKTGSIPDAREMRSEIDAFLRGDSTVLRGYDAF